MLAGACDFVRSKSLFERTYSECAGCGYAADNSAAMVGQNGLAWLLPWLLPCVRFQALNQKGGSVSRHNPLKVRPARAILLFDLFRATRLGSLPILGRDRRRIDELLSKSGGDDDQGNQCNGNNKIQCCLLKMYCRQ
jgi:hypothetical protein